MSSLIFNKEGTKLFIKEDEKIVHVYNLGPNRKDILETVMSAEYIETIDAETGKRIKKHKINYYICKDCCSEDNGPKDEPCLLTLIDRTDKPIWCPFAMGANSNWKKITEEEYQKTVNQF